MIYTDSAYAMLSEALQKQGIEIESNEITEEVVVATASANNVDIEIWFEADSQQFGFNMLTGGSKKYSTIEEFVKYFKTYFDLNTDLVPKSKLISNTCEESLGITTIYDTFKGNKNSGYYVVFRVLGDDNRELQISQDNKDKHLYKAELVLYNDEKTQKKSEHEFLYELTDDMNIRELVTLDSYITGLGKYDEDATIELRRIGTYEFVITYEEINVLHYTMTINGGKVTYYVKKYNDTDFNPNLIVDLKDATDLYGLRDIVSKKAEPKGKKKKKEVSGVNELLDKAGDVLHGIEEVTVSEEELSEVGEVKEENSNIDFADDLMQGAFEDTEIEEVISDIDTNLEEKAIEEETIEENNIEEIGEEEMSNDKATEIEEIIEDEVAVGIIDEVEDSVVEPSSIESNEGDIEIEYVKLIKTDGRITGLLFITKDALYKVNKEVALEFIPLNIIEEFTVSTKARGISLTEEEKVRKQFAKEVSHDKEFCEKLVVALFN